MSAPMSVGILAVLSVGIADAYFLGQLGGAPLAAVGYIYPVTTAITSLAIGASAGANSAVSQAIGRGDDDGAPERLALHAVVFGTMLGALAALVFWIGHVPLFRLMGASPDVLAEISKYVPLWCLSFPFLVVMMITNSVYRAYGDSFTAAAIMVMAAVVNIGLNPIVIFGWGIIPDFGTGGAALSTLMSRVLGAGVVVALAVRAGRLVWGCSPSKDVGASVKELGSVGGPAALSNAINPAGMAAVTAAVATLGDAAVAGFGAATRVQSVALVVLLALSSGIGPVVGQNWGADKPARARAAVASAWAVCVGYGLALSVILSLAAPWIAGMIAPSQEEAGYATQYLQIVSWSLFGYGVLVTMNAALNARSKALYAMSLSAGRVLFVYLPLAWVGVMVFGYAGILAAAIAANLLVVAGAVWAGKRTNLINGLVGDFKDGLT
ncbi:MATE family efflux transporter [Nereida sp. MMG025]|uniref:MATE family efflux transporter n=1 Tax=Nereida sp. MMG025 TaxID=2909981 RepID=UPI001F0286E8|nr:MATE family efflux transporter [Nereida sp. MMG025]MCF6445845.1 MATE family efflux transporter [Nereida sp. MMG025]